MVALLSRASMERPNPRSEWLKARAIGNRLGIDDFIVPLNTEGLRPDQIIWNLQTTNYIPFVPSWAEGLAALLKKLESIATPRALVDGPLLAVESITSELAVQNECEVLLSNCLEITQMPRYIRTFVASPGFRSREERRAMHLEWACWDVTPHRILAFHDPPTNLVEGRNFQCVREVAWRDVDKINDIDSRDLAVALLRKCLDRLLAARGFASLTSVKGHDQWYLPHGLLPQNRVSVMYPNGRGSWFRGVGERSFPTRDGGELYRYHMSPSLGVLRNGDGPSALFVINRIHLTDSNGIPLERQKIPSRRKHLCRNWFNKEWCARTLGVTQLLAGDDMCIRFGPEGEQQLIINAMPIALDAPRSIRDDLVDEPDENLTAWDADNDADDHDTKD